MFTLHYIYNIAEKIKRIDVFAIQAIRTHTLIVTDKVFSVIRQQMSNAAKEPAPGVKGILIRRVCLSVGVSVAT